MSNRATIEPTEFVNIRNGERSLGVRVYDNFDQTYDNTWDEIPKDDLDILRKLMESTDEKINVILDSVRINEKGISIGGTWYGWDEIKVCF